MGLASFNRMRKQQEDAKANTEAKEEKVAPKKATKKQTTKKA